MLHIGLNKPEYNLTNEDIAGTKTQIVKFTTTREPSNPLNPVYKLPSFTYVAPPVPKFIRDGMIIEDIEGTRPLQKREFAPRETNKIDDIYGATKKQPYIRIKTGETAFDNLSYIDVTRKSWTSKRMTNPLNPTYTVWDQTLGEFGRKQEFSTLNAEYGTIKGAQPTGLKKQIAGARNLDTQDIQGAQSSTLGKGNFTWMERRQVRELNKIDDIVGCQASTLKRAPQGSRKLNPLEPDYQYLGNSENINLQNDPFGNRHSSMAKANFEKASQQGVQALKQ